ncbi:hypothetical protein [Streptomyces catenulae]|uniref:Uncharacterized protein n=1 Tax=Streptomyces catenulae TaxID=66875 RepID=A0ABV2Z7U1_9ACTN|nr:hypothetical protein [Streptomyces catenulae]
MAVLVVATLLGWAWLSDAGAPPLESRAAALATTEQQVRNVAADAGIGISGRYNPGASYETCGRRGVPAPTEGPYTLTYTAYADLPDRMHIAALRRLRAALERKDGVEITAYEERPQVQEAQLDADDGPHRRHIAVASAKPPHTVRLAVSTECFRQPVDGR